MRKAADSKIDCRKPDFTGFREAQGQEVKQLNNIGNHLSGAKSGAKSLVTPIERKP